VTADQFEDAADDDSFADDRYGHVSSGTTTPTVTYVNEAGVPQDVLDEVRNNREIASVVERWSQSLSSAQYQTPTLDLFNRRRWKQETHLHAQMAACAWAVEYDDVLATLADVTEGLMFEKMRFELYDEDQEDLWNQWAGKVDLDSRLREQARELFKVSQVYVGLWWEQEVFQVRDNLISETIDEFKAKQAEREYEEQLRQAELQGLPKPPKPPELDGPGRGNRKRRKKFPVTVPTAMTIFEPTKVIPVGDLMFGRERFAYVADRGEDESIASVMGGDIADGTVLQLIERKYEPTESDKKACEELGIDPGRLWLFKKDAVYRHTLTKAPYERFAPLRLQAILPIIDMKSHLRASDRASLVGNTNFIIVITKGTDKLPAKPAEIENLQEQARVVARLPVLVGDHRLHVEIVAPSTDHTLTESRWQALDARLVFRALQTFSPITQGGNSGGGQVSEMSRVVAKGLESRRHMIVRSLERHIFKLVLERNEGVLDERPQLEFSPKRITLDFKADVMAQILKLRDRGDISRETTLEELDYDQEREVLRRARERAEYDQVFSSATPFASPTQQPYATGQPGQPPGQQPGPPGQPNVGPNGQPRTEGGRPAGKTEDEPRAKKGTNR
jgi:hypothetical protein